MLEAVSYAIRASAIDCLRLLLPYATRQRPDGSYEYFRGEDFYDQVTFLLLGEAIEKKDDPALFRIVWRPSSATLMQDHRIRIALRRVQTGNPVLPKTKPSTISSMGLLITGAWRR